MKILKNIIAFLTLSIALFSCAKEEDIESSATTVGHSSIIFFPTIETLGDKTMYLNVGDTYTDPGAEAILGGAPTTYTVDGSVNTAVPGIYNLTYLAANPEGYTAEDWRCVVVMGNDIAANDFSGSYIRAATGQACIWTKTAPGFYDVENPGGAGAGVGLHCVAVNYTGLKIGIPKQNSDLGIISSNSEIMDPSITKFQWALSAGGYGTQVRFFVK